MQSTVRLALIRSRFSVLNGNSVPFSVAPAVPVFRPIPSLRHAATCGGVKFRSVSPSLPDEPFAGPPPVVPEYVSLWKRPEETASPMTLRWIRNGFAVGAPIQLP